MTVTADALLSHVVADNAKLAGAPRDAAFAVAVRTRAHDALKLLDSACAGQAPLLVEAVTLHLGLVADKADRARRDQLSAADFADFADGALAYLTVREAVLAGMLSNTAVSDDIVGAHWQALGVAAAGLVAPPVLEVPDDAWLLERERVAPDPQTDVPTRALNVAGLGVLLSRAAARRVRARPGLDAVLVHELLHAVQPPPRYRALHARHAVLERALQEGVTEALTALLCGDDDACSDRYRRWRSATIGLAEGSGWPVEPVLWALSAVPRNERCEALADMLCGDRRDEDVVIAALVPLFADGPADSASLSELRARTAEVAQTLVGR